MPKPDFTPLEAVFTGMALARLIIEHHSDAHVYDAHGRPLKAMGCRSVARVELAAYLKVWRAIARPS